jgi:hypothetical protein
MRFYGGSPSCAKGSRISRALIPPLIGASQGEEAREGFLFAGFLLEFNHSKDIFFVRGYSQLLRSIPDASVR